MYKTIAESNNFIVLDKFTKYFEVNDTPAVYPVGRIVPATSV
jgi:type I restriction enzyme, R subunit